MHGAQFGRMGVRARASLHPPTKHPAQTIAYGSFIFYFIRFPFFIRTKINQCNALGRSSDGLMSFQKHITLNSMEEREKKAEPSQRTSSV